jgi:uncharacterized protein (TIGR00251 family)
MVIRVSVKAGSKTESVVKLPDGSYSVRVKAPAKEGRANGAAIGAIGEYLGVPKSRISISRGLASKNKTLTIL